MRSFKAVVVSAVIAMGVFFGVSYSSCSKDSCKGVTCINNGQCGGGVCMCKAGVGGLNCELIYRDIYSNTYKGSGGPDDSGRLYHDNIFTFTATADSDYQAMSMVWTNPGVHTVSFPVKLTHNASSGSTFTLSSATVDTFSFSGSGSITANVASVTIVETHPHSTPITITLNNFVRQ